MSQSSTQPSFKADRLAKVDAFKKKLYDVLIIGGGINGATSAASLSARGYKIALIDQADFAAKTSQGSSNLVWGGIKYLENFEFGLVNNLCKSRNKLMKAYPSMIKEIRFFIPIFTGGQFNIKRHPFTLSLGTWFYWCLGRCFTKRPKSFATYEIDSQDYPFNIATLPKKGMLKSALEYSDAYLPENDSRFVYRLLDRAQEKLATLINYTRLTSQEFDSAKKIHTFSVEDLIGKEKIKIRAKWCINASGPWVDSINQSAELASSHRHLFSKGVHLIFKKIFKEEKVISFFDQDERLFFAIPMGNRTVIGTTDTKVEKPEPEVTEEDRDFILSNINPFLDAEHQLTKKDIISERCGVRALVLPINPKKKENQNEGASNQDWLHLSRKHVVEIKPTKNTISLFGGKITDCLNIGDEVYHKLKPHLSPKQELGQKHRLTRQQPWYGEGTNNQAIERTEVLQSWKQKYLVLPKKGLPEKKELAQIGKTWWRRYGLKALKIMALVNNADGLTEIISGCGYYKAELRYIAENEQVVFFEDLLRRRTKLALTEKKEDLDDNLFLKNLKKGYK